MSEDFTEFNHSPGQPENQYDLLELEIAERVVRTAMQMIVDEESPNSKNHLYQMWCHRWGNTSRARFDTWLEMLNIKFVRIVKVTGLYPPNSAKETKDVVMAFDNESDGDHG